MAEKAVLLGTIYYASEFQYYNACVCLMRVYMSQDNTGLAKEMATHILQKHKQYPESQCKPWHKKAAVECLVRFTVQESVDAKKVSP